MEREIDRHERVKSVSPKHNNSTLTKIDLWRKAWAQCYDIVDQWETFDIKKFHYVLERWIPILNRVFNYPILHLETKYQMILLYCDEPCGNKEVIHFIFDDNPTPDGSIKTFIIFNVYEFRKIFKNYCSNFSRNNVMLIDENRGTINMQACQGFTNKTADYFKYITTYHLLFIYTLHAMAHLNVFHIHDHSHYDNHAYVKDSPFFKLYFYGQILHS